ncbi:MAG: response regulator transcription factor [Magnetococcales bacterium]|nr:response regulator transcription factor [Magnetococcales bacterium]
MRILVIEDNQDLVANIFDFMEARGHTVDTAHDGLVGLHLAMVNTYDVIVLDLVLPGMSGITLCQELRQTGGKDTPILMLTALDTTQDKILGLESGGDDYVVKPFSLLEVETRLRALVRRDQGRMTKKVLTVGALVLDLETHTLFRSGQELFLPPISMNILEILMRRHPAVVTRSDLEYAIWKDHPPGSDALRTHIHLLRDTLDKPFASAMLKTIRSVGFQLVAAN